MVTQSDFPSKWSCESEDKRCVVEVRVPDRSEDTESGGSSTQFDVADDTNINYQESVNRLVVRPPETQFDADRTKLVELEVGLYRIGSNEPQTTFTLSNFEKVGPNRFITPKDEVIIRGGNQEFRVDVAVYDLLTVGTQNRDTPYTWIEIPTQKVEQWIEKGSDSQIQRTAKIEFPTEWGENTDDVIHNSPRRLVKGFQDTGDTDGGQQRPYSGDEEDREFLTTSPLERTIENIESPSSLRGSEFNLNNYSGQDAFRHARIWWRSGDGTWILQHYGWISGVGGTQNQNRHKMWVYDFSQLLSGVPVGISFTDPTIEEAIEEIAQRVNDNTPIPMSGVTVIPPQTEQEFTKAASVFGEQESSTADVYRRGGAVGRGGAGTAYYSLEEEQFVPDGQVDFPIGDDEDVVEVPKEIGEDFTATTIDTEGKQFTGDELFEAAALSTVPVIGTFPSIVSLASSARTRTKEFSSNRDTLSDLFVWFEEKTGAKLHFEPKTYSVELVVDIIPSRRLWAQKEVITQADVSAAGATLQPREEGSDEYNYHAPISVLSNTALYETNPVNTLVVRGAKNEALVDGFTRRASGLNINLEEVGGSYNPFNDDGDNENALEYETPAREYPVAKARSPSLYQAADEFEMTGKLVESDATTLNGAKKEARKRLTDILAEPAEGEIVTNGNARMMPFDRVDTFEVCNGQTEFEQEPVQYEIESVKYEMQEGTYRNYVKPSIWANETNIVIVDEETQMVQQQ